MRQVSRLSLRDILSIVFRDKNRILIVVLTSVLAASLWLSFQDSVYVAESRALVRVGKEKLSGIESYAKDSYNILFQERGQDIHNGIEILRDKQLVYTVYSRLQSTMRPPSRPQSWYGGMKYDLKAFLRSLKEWAYEPLYALGLRARLSPEEEQVRALQAALHVEAIEDSDILRVTFGWTDPHFAALAANTFVEEFLNQYIRVHENEQSEGFYRDQIALQEGHLTNADANLERFRAKHGITNLALQKELLLKEISSEEARLDAVTIRYDEYRTLRDGVVDASRKGTEWIQTPEFRQRGTLDLSELDRQFFDLVARRAQYATTHTSASIEMRQIAERIGQLREQKAASLIAFFTLNMKTAAQERSFLDTRLRDRRTQLAKLDQQTTRLAELERARHVAEQNYLTYRKKAEELRVSDQLDEHKISGVRVISDARPPAEPSSPRRGLILGLSVLLGLFLGVGYSACAEYFNHTFRNGEDVERILGTRLLLTVPRIAADG